MGKVNAVPAKLPVPGDKKAADKKASGKKKKSLATSMLKHEEFLAFVARQSDVQQEWGAFSTTGFDKSQFTTDYGPDNKGFIGQWNALHPENQVYTTPEELEELRAKVWDEFLFDGDRITIFDITKALGEIRAKKDFGYPQLKPKSVVA